MCSDGFTTAALPQKSAGNAFHATFGSGVLKLMTSAATPSGWRTVRTVRLAIYAVVVRPYDAAALAGDEEAHLDRGVRLPEGELLGLAGLRH